MPGQYVNSRYSRPMMSLLRCIKNALQLWIMIHAASIVIVFQERCHKGFLFFWEKRPPAKLTYYDALSMVPASEYLILAMVAAVLRSIYTACGCELVGSQNLGQIGNKPRMEVICVCAPYIGAFLGCWIFSTYAMASQLLMRPPYHPSVNFYTPLILGLIFKVLIMANMTSLCLRAYVRMYELAVDWHRGHISTLNLGERLNLLFSN
ncbi:hypothetical protein KR032_009038 [Drosophila birchii]|nr:hypothetical protein KR032_009038 [Drosophila birchii]